MLLKLDRLMSSSPALSKVATGSAGESETVLLPSPLTALAFSALNASRIANPITSSDR